MERLLRASRNARADHREAASADRARGEQSGSAQAYGGSRRRAGRHHAGRNAHDAARTGIEGEAGGRGAQAHRAVEICMSTATTIVMPGTSPGMTTSIYDAFGAGRGVRPRALN